jgi:hypothetical protein
LRHKDRRQNNAREFGSSVRLRWKLDEQRRVRAALFGLLVLMTGRHVLIRRAIRRASERALAARNEKSKAYEDGLEIKHAHPYRIAS